MPVSYDSLKIILKMQVSYLQKGIPKRPGLYFNKAPMVKISRVDFEVPGQTSYDSLKVILKLWAP